MLRRESSTSDLACPMCKAGRVAYQQSFGAGGVSLEGYFRKGYNLGIQWRFPQLSKVLFSLVNAGIAQLVEQLICNQQVVGSNPTAGSN